MASSSRSPRASVGCKLSSTSTIDDFGKWGQGLTAAAVKHPGVVCEVDCNLRRARIGRKLSKAHGALEVRHLFGVILDGRPFAVGFRCRSDSALNDLHTAGVGAIDHLHELGVVIELLLHQLRVRTGASEQSRRRRVWMHDERHAAVHAPL